MPQKPEVSVVIISWNRREDVRESLRRLRAQSFSDIEVIVVDNASADGTSEMIEKEFPEVRRFRTDQNIGVAAYNIGFKSAKGEYIVILDDDSFPAEDAIKTMVAKFENDPRLGIVAFDVRNYAHYDDVSIGGDSQENHSATTEEYLMGFNGAGAGVRREVLEKVGYYPEEFFLYWNEQDLAFRVLDAGYTIKFFSDIVSYHKYSPVNRASWRAPFYHVRNAFWLIWKHYPLEMLVPLTFKMVYLVFYHSMEQKTSIYLRAMGSAVREMEAIMAKRQPVKSHIAHNLRVPVELSFTFYR